MPNEGITVNVVAPGVIVAPSAKKALPHEAPDTAIKMRCLASTGAGLITGQTIIVDGGTKML